MIMRRNCFRYAGWMFCGGLATLGGCSAPQQAATPGIRSEPLPDVASHPVNDKQPAMVREIATIRPMLVSVGRPVGGDVGRKRDIDSLPQARDVDVFSFDRAGTGETALPRRRPAAWQAESGFRPRHILPVTTPPNRLEDTAQHTPDSPRRVIRQAMVTPSVPPLPVRAPWRGAVANGGQHQDRTPLDQQHEQIATVGLEAQEKAAEPDRTSQAGMYTISPGIQVGEKPSHLQPEQRTTRKDGQDAMPSSPAKQTPPGTEKAKPELSIADNGQGSKGHDREVFHRILSAHDQLVNEPGENRLANLPTRQDGDDALVAEIGRYREEISAILGWRTLSMQYRVAFGSYPAHLERDEKENSFALTITVGERKAGESFCQTMVAHGQSCWLRERVGSRRVVPPPVLL